MWLRNKSVRPLLAGVVAAAGIFTLSLNTATLHADAKAQSQGPAASDPIVEIDTTKGPIKIKVFKKEAPVTSDNFLDLVSRNFYNGLTFHRYEPGFVIQGGDPVGNGSGDFIDPQTHQKRTIKLEKSKELMEQYPFLRHDTAGTVAMARSDNPDSASCQYYITLGPASFLDKPPGYAVFGHVVDGLDNVMKLRAGDKMTKVFITK